jgi:hypothetical protein
MVRTSLLTQLLDALALAVANWHWRREEYRPRAPSLVVDDLDILMKRSD